MNDHDEKHALKCIIEQLASSIPLGYVFNKYGDGGDTEITIIKDQYLYQPHEQTLSIVNDIFANYAGFNYIIHEYGVANDLLVKHDFKTVLSCKPEYCIYQRLENYKLPILSHEERNAIANRTQKIYDHYENSAQEFLKGAIWFINVNQYPLALFMLHQAMELTFKSILYAYNKTNKIQTHDLKVLCRKVAICEPKYCRILGMKDDEVSKVLKDIQQGYIHGRYDIGYKITLEKMLPLLAMTSSFVSGVQLSIQKRFSLMRQKVEF